MSRNTSGCYLRNQVFPCPGTRFTTAQLQLLQKRLRVAGSMAPSVVVEVRIHVTSPAKEPFHRDSPNSEAMPAEYDDANISFGP